MPKLIISGCNGRMGRVVESICNGIPDCSIIAGFDILGAGDRDFPVFSNPAEFTGVANVLIDFSNPAALKSLLAFGQEKQIPLILATTGYSDAQLALIEHTSKTLPIFRSANFSLGVNVMLELVKRATAILGSNYDIEIIERHHNRKVDAPSGTALLLADATASMLSSKPDYTYDRHTVRQPRGTQEIGISSVRGGGIVGDHEVIFAGRDEVIEIRHSAISREVFASGAVAAARFMSTISVPGLYTMADLVAHYE